MQVIRQQNEIDVFYSAEDHIITISETNGHFDSYSGKYEDVFINIDPVHIDAIINALQYCKEESLKTIAKQKASLESLNNQK